MQVFTLFVLLGFPVALLLAWAFEMTPEGIKADADVPRDSITPATGQRLNYVILGLVVLAVGFLIADQYVLDQGMRASVVGSTRSVVTPPTTTPSSELIRRTRINLLSTGPVGDTGQTAHVAISRDGRLLVYAAQVQGTVRLYLRALDELEAHPMPGTDGAFNPFFSPDGEWVGFYSDATDQRLKKVSVRGGPPQVLADAGFAAGAFWGTDDLIVFGTQDASGGRGIYRVPAAGGAVELLMTSNDAEGYVTPHLLPDGNSALLVVRPGVGGTGNARGGRIVTHSFATGESRTLVFGGFAPRYAPTGHVVFLRGGALWAVPFDAERLEAVGFEAVVLEGVEHDGFRGGATYAFSSDGLLVYVTGGDTGLGISGQRTLVWVDREGREEPLDADARAYFTPRLSPDGRRLATRIIQGGGWDIWIDDLARGTSSRLTFDPSLDWSPLWSPDGERVVFVSFRDGGSFLQVAADGTGQVEEVLLTSSVGFLQSFSPDGSNLIFDQHADVHVLSMEEGSTPHALLDSTFLENLATISPDGRWIAYQSNESGRLEVYVRPFPNTDDGKWQVSANGGTESHWGPDGRELFYREANRMMVVSIETEPDFLVGVADELFSGTYATPSNQTLNYDVSPDGQRFLMMKATDEAQRRTEDAQLIVVENWFEELNRLAPPSP